MTIPKGGYSAEVRLQLIVDGQTLEVDQVAPGSCLLEHPIDHPPCEAELVSFVDGNRRSCKVFLQNGISSSSRRVTF